MTDEDDDGLLIGNVNTSGIPIQPIIPCSGIHPNQSIFAHTSCAHGLDVNLPVCTTVGLSGVLITDPSMVAVSSAAIGQSNFNQLFNQQSDDLNDINIPIPNTSQLQLQQQTMNANNYISTATITTATNKTTGSNQEQVKKVQFQSVHPAPPNVAPYIAQFTNQELLQRAASPATFVLPVSMANPNLGKHAAKI